MLSICKHLLFNIYLDLSQKVTSSALGISQWLLAGQRLLHAPGRLVYFMPLILIVQIKPATRLSRHNGIAMPLIKTARSIDLEIIAESVERQSEWDVLRELGVDGVQGYLPGVPVQLL